MVDKKNVVVIGAGKIGSTIVSMLSKEYNVTVVDENLTALDKMKKLGVKIRPISVFNHEAMATLFDKKDYVINAGPHFIATQVATVAADFEVNYFDLTEDIEETENIKKLAKKISYAVFVPQCGLAPGFISIIANHMIRSFEQVEDVKMRVGALPQYPNNRLKYNMTWSTDGLINEYLHKCNAIRNGELVKIDPLEGYETFTLDGDQYEAFNTSGGLGSMCETWLGRVKNMDYKTVRYPGHHDLMRFLINDLKLGDNDGMQLKDILNRSVPMTTQDVVLIFVSVSGYRGGKLIQDTWTKKIYGKELFNQKWSAIQLTTAAGVCGMVELHKNGKIPVGNGLVRQEDADFNDFMETWSAKQVYR